ncbi:MAG: hypothetical protein CMJ48_08240 [Planctomycetaceae bacterium]|nr:hypothetical protein [Planctomycetaceae bacterium]
MRLLGNKTRLLGDIEALLQDKGVCDGTFIDIFCGTAKVGRHFKSRGFRVLANDWLASCHAKAVAEVEVSRYPSYRALREKHRRELTSTGFQKSWQQGAFPFAAGEGTSVTVSNAAMDRAAKPLSDVIHFLGTRVEPEEGLIFRSFCPGGSHDRRYFTDENGKRIDGILRFLREGHRQELLSRHELYLLVSALLDAADRVANITGTYGAYLKHFQSSARRPLELVLPTVVRSPSRHRAYRGDSNELVASLKGDVLYIDPPYNTRQYAANYHILEILAEYHEIEDLDAYEKRLYGKTGLRPYEHRKSAYCVAPGRGRGGRDALTAMTDLILSSRARCVVVSYNEEGLLSRDQLGGILALFGGVPSYDFRKNMRQVLYQRFRSDSDRPKGHPSGARNYKVIEGKKRNQISEWLLFAARASGRKTAGVPKRVGLPGTS